MTVAVQLERAVLIELDDAFRDPRSGGRRVPVQFNPETLKVTFSNQLQEPPAGDQRGGATRQYVGSSTTKLALQLWFDVTAPVPEGDSPPVDVRILTEQVSYFITPQPRDITEGGRTRSVNLPPAVRFSWGTFLFDGTLDSLDETLEYWSEDGRPLRSSLALGLSQQRIAQMANEAARRAAAARQASAAAAGTRPLTPAGEGQTVQGMADRSGRGDDWQSIAASNGIENPRQLAPGQLLDLGGAR